MTSIVRGAVGAAALALALALGGCAASTAEPGPSATPAASVDADDVMFVTMMIPHHEQAIEMSDTLLAKSGVDERVRDLAQQIKDAQQPEITLMQSWLDEWGVASPGAGHGDMGHGDGMMSGDEMQALQEADGAEASRLFLEQMIVHHEGAIAMAQAELTDGSDAQVVELARAIIDSQTVEIQTMRDLAGQL